jgi:hypothetical protein
MRIIRLANMPAIVRIRRRAEVMVVVPAHTSTPDVLTAAGLVLSTDEFAELQAAMAEQHAATDPHGIADWHEPAGAHRHRT